MYRIAAMALLGAALCSGAMAQTHYSTHMRSVQLAGGLGMGFSSVAAALVGSMVIANAPVPVRKSPPHGYLARPGKKIDELSREDAYEIRDAKVLPHVFSTQTWILLGRPGADETLGWAYFGKNASKSKNFVLPQ